jgi:hypothetical protein
MNLSQQALRSLPEKARDPVGFGGVESVPLDRGGGWEQNEPVMVRYSTSMTGPVDARRASLLGGVVVVVGLIISLLLVTQA